MERPSRPPELRELSWVLTELGVSDQQLGLASAHQSLVQCKLHGGVSNYPLYDSDEMQMEDYQSCDAIVSPQINDDLDELLAGFFDPIPSQEAKSSRNVRTAFVTPTVERRCCQLSCRPAHGQISEPGDNYMDPSLLEPLLWTLGSWGKHGHRRCRTRSTFWRVEINHMFVPQVALTSGGRKRSRKNNPSWCSDEVEMLILGVSTYGVGRWTDIQKAYFQTSIRTAAHLKDKWKNLKAACGCGILSKKEVKPLKSTQQILDKVKDKIIDIVGKNHAAARSSKERPSRRQKT